MAHSDVAPTLVVEYAPNIDPFTVPKGADWVKLASSIGAGIRSYDLNRGWSSEDFSRAHAGTLSIDVDNRTRALDPLLGNLVAGTHIRSSWTHPDLDAVAPLFGGTTADKIVRTGFAFFPSTALSIFFRTKGTYAAVGNNSAEAFFSYAVTGSMDEVSIVNGSNLTIRLKSAAAVNTGISLDDGKPHRVGVIWRSSDGLLRVLVDDAVAYEGTYQQGASLTTGGTLVLGQLQTTLGGGFSQTNSLKGYLSEVQLWKVARTVHGSFAETWIQLDGTQTNLTSYWKLNEGGTAGFCNDTKTGAPNQLTLSGATWSTFQLPAYRFDGFVEDPDVGYDVSNTDSVVRIQAADANSLLAQLKPQKLSAYRRTVLAQAPYLYWPLDESVSTASDISGHARTGTYSATAEQVVDNPFPAGDTNKGVRFNPGANVASAAGVVAFERTQAFSLSFIFRFIGAPDKTSAGIRIAQNVNASGRGIYLQAIQQGFELGLISTTTTNEQRAQGHLRAMDGYAHHVAVVYSGTPGNTSVAMYVDGVSVVVDYPTNVLSATIVDAAMAFTIGPNLTRKSDAYEVNHFAVFNRALTATEVNDQFVAAFEPLRSQPIEQRAALILDSIGWPASLRDFRKCVSWLGPKFDPIGDGLNHLQDIAKLELAAIYVDELGRIVVDDRYFNSFESPVLYTYGDDAADQVGYARIKPKVSRRDVGDEVVAGKTPDGAEFSVSDAAATSRFAPKTFDFFGPWATDEQAKATADVALPRVTTQPKRFDSVGFSANPRTWVPILRARMRRDRVLVKRAHMPGGGAALSVNSFIEQMTEKYNPSQGLLVDFGLGADYGSRSDLFIVGKSALDGNWVLA